MERLTGKQAKSLLEAYQQVYTPVITEEVLDQSAGYWVAACIDEGINFEDYTLDEITEAFITDTGETQVINEFLGMPGAQNFGADLRQKFGQARRAVGGALANVGRGYVDAVGATAQGLAGQRTTSQNPIARAGNMFTRNLTAVPRAAMSAGMGFLTGKGATQRPAAPAPSNSQNTPTPASGTPAAPAKPTGAADPRNQQYQKDRAAIATAKTPEAKAAATKKAEATGMAAWAKANPEAAAKVKPGQAGYETIQKTLNPQKPTAATTATNTATAATGLSGKGALSTKPAPAVGKPVAGAKPVPTGTAVQGGVKPVAGAPTASAANTKFGVAKPAAAAPAPAAKPAIRPEPLFGPGSPGYGSGKPAAAKPAQTRAQELAAIQAKAKADTLKKSRLGEDLQTEGILDAIKKVARKALEPADNSPEAQAARVNARRPRTELEKKVGQKTQEVLNREEYDNFDLIQAYLIDEGATEQEALDTMFNMEDDQREEILEFVRALGKKVGEVARDVKDRVTGKKELLGGHAGYIRVGGPTKKGDTRVSGIGPVGTYARDGMYDGSNVKSHTQSMGGRK